MTTAEVRVWRATAAVATVILAVSAGVAACTLSHSRAAGARAGVSGPTLERAVRSALGAELRVERLSFQGIACVRNGRTFHDHPVVRCNVNFGDPHIEAYCAVVTAGRLLTNHQDASIPCGPDRVGWQVQVFSSGGRG